MQAHVQSARFMCSIPYLPTLRTESRVQLTYSYEYVHLGTCTVETTTLACLAIAVPFSTGTETRQAPVTTPGS